MTLLIDADILIYKAAAGNQVDIDWGDVTSTGVDLEGAKEEIYGKLALYNERLEEHTVGHRDDFVLCFGGSGNFRKDLLPSYKGNRKDKDRPKLLGELRKWCELRWDCRSEPMLEGDDMLGLLWEPGDVVVSQDKDLKGVPCSLYNPNHPDKGVVEIDQLSADWWHFLQALTGDACDGYKGCPGVGPAKAKKILDAAWVAYCFCFSKDSQRAAVFAWEAIVRAYESKGLNEADALAQARVARILRAGDYDFTTKTITLWEPIQ